MPNQKRSEPTIVVIFGASGDLTARKLLPALYNLNLDKLLTDRLAVVVLDRFAMGHAARSVLLVDRLPRLRELPRDALVRSPGAAADAVLEQLGALSQGDRLAAWVVVASALADAYDAHLSRCTPVADRPLLARLPAQLDRLRADAVDARTRIGPDRPPVEMLDLLEATCGFTA